MTLVRTFGVLGALIVSNLILADSAVAQTSVEPIMKVVDFGTSKGPVTVSHDGVEVTVQEKSDPKDPYLSDYQAVVRIPGAQVSIIELGRTHEGAEIGVGIGRLAKSDVSSSVIFESYSGGAHCCALLEVVVSSGGRLRTIDFPPVDGGPDHVFPSDLDGDGVRDFMRQDDRFRYQFSSGAGSFSPPKIYNIFKGSLVDVSAESGFKNIWERFSSQTKARCSVSSDLDRNGACIAFLAAEAVLGRFNVAFPTAVKLANNSNSAELPSACKVELQDYICPPASEVKFATFETAARWFLKENGYID